MEGGGHGDKNIGMEGFVRGARVGKNIGLVCAGIKGRRAVGKIDVA